MKLIQNYYVENPDEEWSPIVLDITEGKISYENIAYLLNDYHVSNKRGALFTPQKIRSILPREALIKYVDGTAYEFLEETKRCKKRKREIKIKNRSNVKVKRKYIKKNKNNTITNTHNHRCGIKYTRYMERLIANSVITTLSNFTL
jgi:hypothetical protein